MAFDKIPFPGNNNDPFEPKPMGERVSCFWHEKKESIPLADAKDIYLPDNEVCKGCKACQDEA